MFFGSKAAEPWCADNGTGADHAARAAATPARASHLLAMSRTSPVTLAPGSLTVNRAIQSNVREFPRRSHVAGVKRILLLTGPPGVACIDVSLCSGVPGLAPYPSPQT